MLVTIKASPTEAAVLVVAPHFTFVDSLAIVLSRSTPVGKAEFQNFPILGKIALFLQVVLVKREREESRKNAVSAIKRHVTNVLVSFIESLCSIIQSGCVGRTQIKDASDSQ